MFKFLVFILSLSMSLFAIDLNLKPVEMELLKIEDIYGYAEDSPDVKLDSSSAVIQRFQTSEGIIARASVTAKEKGLTELKFSVFADPEQDTLPLPNVAPQKGNEVVLNFLYDRGLVIASDEQTYNELVFSFPEIYFTHINTLEAQLIRSSSPAPKRSDFRKFCADNAVGILVFALEDKARIVDCQDFSELYELTISKPSSIQVPFYSRIGGYKSNFLDFSSQGVGSYYRYYGALVNIPRVSQ